MQVKARQLDSVNAIASIKISSAMIENEIQNLAKKASKNLKMDGFRPGKVPIRTILKRYQKQLNDDAEQNLFRCAINDALKELKKDSKELVAQPYFEQFDRKEGEIMAQLILSFKPEFKLDGYEELIPKYQLPQITQEEIEQRRQSLLKSLGTTKPIQTQRALQEGDFAQFDFEAFIDNKDFDGSKAQNYVLEIGSKTFIPGFEEAMIGMKIGEEKDIKLTFPKEYNPKHLAQKDVVFKVKLHEIKELELPKLDEELLKKILPKEEEPSLALLDKKIQEELKNEKILKLINELKPKFAHALLEKYNFDLPRAIVEQEINIQFHTALNHFSQRELEELKTHKEKYQEKRDSFKEEAQKSVKLTFIVDELARLRKIEVNDQELVQAIYFEAYRHGMDPKEHLQNYKEQGNLAAIKMALIEQKLFNDILMPKIKDA